MEEIEKEEPEEMEEEEPGEEDPIEVGAEHEMEHTDNPEEARKIAQDHLDEHGPVYYPVLDIAEDFMETIKGMPESKRRIYIKKLSSFVQSIST